MKNSAINRARSSRALARNLVQETRALRSEAHQARRHGRLRDLERRTAVVMIRLLELELALTESEAISTRTLERAIAEVEAELQGLEHALYGARS